MALQNGCSPLTLQNQLAHHRALVHTYVKASNKYKTRTFMAKYDQSIDKDTIKYFLSRSIGLFVSALAHNKLSQITNYI